MSVPRGVGQNGGRLYSNITQPAMIDLSFVVTPTNGLGITSLKSNGYVRNVFMHTSTTPSANDGYTNPNPPNGYALIQFKNNFNKFLGLDYVVSGPGSGSGTTTTANSVYIIASLGTATLAQWQAKGLPAGMTPAVGQSFVATASGTIGGSATVVSPGSSGIASVEVVGDPNTSIANSAIAQNGGAWLLLQFMGSVFTGSALTSHTHDFTVIGGQAASTTNNIAAYAGPLIGKEAATDATFVGANSATNGGVVAASAGTPAGSMTLAAAAPTTGSVISLSTYFDLSSVTIDGL